MASKSMRITLRFSWPIACHAEALTSQLGSSLLIFVQVLGPKALPNGVLWGLEKLTDYNGKTTKQMKGFAYYGDLTYLP